MAAPIIIGATGEGTPGWRTVFDYAGRADPTQRVRILMGPASIDTERTAVMSALRVLSIDPSVSPGSAVATLRVTYSTQSVVTIPTGQYRAPVIELSPLAVSIDLKCHPALDGVQANIAIIDQLIAQGDVDQISTQFASSPASLQYARLALAGVRSYEASAHSLSITRYFDSPPSLSADYHKLGQVFSWANISTAGDGIPSNISEPQYVPFGGGSPQSYEWRAVGISPRYERNADNVINWTYMGMEAWASWLYYGGSWEPPAL